MQGVGIVRLFPSLRAHGRSHPPLSGATSLGKRDAGNCALSSMSQFGAATGSGSCLCCLDKIHLGETYYLQAHIAPKFWNSADQLSYEAL